MLNKKATMLISVVGAQNIGIAKCSGQSPSDISRLCTGVRTPLRSSKTIRKFARGVYTFATENGTTDMLYKTIGSDKELSTNEAIEAILDWLFEGVATSSDYVPNSFRRDRFHMSDPQKAEKAAALGKRMQTLIELTGLPAAQICRKAEISASAISNFVNGKLLPSMNSETVRRFTAYIEQVLRATDKLGELSEATGLPESELSCETLREWLCDTKKRVSSSSIESFIEDIKHFSPEIELSLPRLSAILTDDVMKTDEKIYRGTRGLQKSVIRFMGGVIEKGGGELFLYSNQDMNWMQGKYGIKWLTLMSEAMKKGIKIHIIHTPNRDPDELLYAVKCWLPLYCLGDIEPYYLSKNDGEIFANTLFIGEDASIEGICVSEAESNGIYRYHTDPGDISLTKSLFDDLMKGAKKLLTVNDHPTHVQGRFDIYNFDGVEICIGDKFVIINKLTKPYLSFNISHPLLYDSFKDYVRTITM